MTGQIGLHRRVSQCCSPALQIHITSPVTLRLHHVCVNSGLCWGVSGNHILYLCNSSWTTTQNLYHFQWVTWIWLPHAQVFRIVELDSFVLRRLAFQLGLNSVVQMKFLTFIVHSAVISVYPCGRNWEKRAINGSKLSGGQRADECLSDNFQNRQPQLHDKLETDTVLTFGLSFTFLSLSLHRN